MSICWEGLCSICAPNGMIGPLNGCSNLFSKAERTHFEKNGGSEPKRWLSESRLSAEEAAELEPGAEIKVDIFEAGQRVDAIGKSKGRGYPGVVQRSRGHRHA